MNDDGKVSQKGFDQSKEIVEANREAAIDAEEKTERKEFCGKFGPLINAMNFSEKMGKKMSLGDCKTRKPVDGQCISKNLELCDKFHGLKIEKEDDLMMFDDKARSHAEVAQVSKRFGNEKMQCGTMDEVKKPHVQTCIPEDDEYALDKILEQIKIDENSRFEFGMSSFSKYREEFVDLLHSAEEIQTTVTKIDENYSGNDPFKAKDITDVCEWMSSSITIFEEVEYIRKRMDWLLQFEGAEPTAANERSLSAETGENQIVEDEESLKVDKTQQEEEIVAKWNEFSDKVAQRWDSLKPLYEALTEKMCGVACTPEDDGTMDWKICRKEQYTAIKDWMTTKRQMNISDCYIEWPRSKPAHIDDSMVRKAHFIGDECYHMQGVYYLILLTQTRGSFPNMRPISESCQKFRGSIGKIPWIVKMEAEHCERWFNSNPTKEDCDTWEVVPVGQQCTDGKVCAEGLVCWTETSETGGSGKCMNRAEIDPEQFYSTGQI
jgi:hypothetical protein